MSAYKIDFEKTEYMYFLIKDNQLLEKYNEIWGVVSDVIKKGFHSEPVYKEKHLRTKTKSCEGKVNQTPKKGSH